MGVVHDINEITRRRQSGNHNKAKVALDGQLRKKHTLLRKLVDEYAALEVLGTGTAPRVLTEEQVDTLMSGASPWQWNQSVGERFLGKEIHRLRTCSGARRSCWCCLLRRRG